MVSFLARGGETAARDIAARTQVFALAESLGGVESLSVGIEEIEDLLADLAQALA